MHPIKILLSTLPLCLAQSSGTFSVMTFNVAGLPSFLNSNEVPGDKTDNAARIGTLLTAAAYSLVHVQEDFNYHASLYSTLTYPYRTPTSGGVPVGSGLNSVSLYPFDSSLARVTWKHCNLNSGDCLTKKGFTFMRLRVADGVEIDAYNLHADAGSDDGDASARSKGVQQILDFAKKNSDGRAMIVAGDTNDRYTNDRESITDLIEGLSLNDPWVDLIKGGVRPTKGAAADACANPAATDTCEVVDKILYRSGQGVNLTAKSFEYASKRFLQTDGNILSDHNPLLVNLAWTKV